MSAREFAEWQAFDQLEPIGSTALELYLAQLTAVVINQQRGRGRAVTLDDCRLDFAPRPAQTPAQVEQVFRSIQRRLGAPTTGRARGA